MFSLLFLGGKRCLSCVGSLLDLLMKNFSAVILASGAGTRMKSSLPKVMHNLSGKPLVKWVIDSVSALKPDGIIAVLGPRC